MNTKILSATQIKILDKLAIETYGIPSIILMENAGRAVAAVVADKLKGKRKARISIVCGTGNNGGDGFVAARHLANNGFDVSVFLIGRVASLKNDAAVNYRILKKSSFLIQETPIYNYIILKHIIKADIVVDALFGVGLNRDISEPYKSYIDGINQKAKYVVAVDVPSGLDATTGECLGSCVQADTTVTFTFSKKGLVNRKGRQFAGDTIVEDIGIPSKLKSKI